MYVRVCVSVHVYVGACVSVCMYFPVCVHVCASVFPCAWIYGPVCVCMILEDVCVRVHDIQACVFVCMYPAVRVNLYEPTSTCAGYERMCASIWGACVRACEGTWAFMFALICSSAVGESFTPAGGGFDQHRDAGLDYKSSFSRAASSFPFSCLTPPPTPPPPPPPPPTAPAQAHEHGPLPGCKLITTLRSATDPPPLELPRHTP